MVATKKKRASRKKKSDSRSGKIEHDHRWCEMCGTTHDIGQHLPPREPLQNLSGGGKQPCKHGTDNEKTDNRGACVETDNSRPPAQSNFLVPALANPKTPAQPSGEAANIGEARESDDGLRSRIDNGDSSGEENNLSSNKGKPGAASEELITSQGGSMKEGGSGTDCPIRNSEHPSTTVQESGQNVTGPAAQDIPQLKPGVYEKISPEIYHRQKAFSRGDMIMAEVPAKLYWHKTHPEVEKVTPAKLIGSAFHTKLLEPDVFDSRYTVSPYENYRTNVAKDWRDEQENAGIVVLSKDQVDMIDQMVQSARELSDFARVFKSTRIQRELTVIAQDPATGLLLRARFDVVPNANIHADLKSAMDGSPEGFGKSAWDLGYGFQAAHYLHVWNLARPDDQRHEFVFLVQEKDPPYLSAMYVTPHSLIEYCDKILRARRYVIAECMRTGKWPGYDTRPLRENEFTLPAWAAREIQESEQ